MEKEVVYDENLHFEHQNWKMELDFWKDELKTFNNRLGELVTRYTSKEVLKQLEHYQNEFALHSGIIEDFRETIEEHEMSIAGHSKTNKQSMDVTLVKTHMDFREKMETQRQIYGDLKKDFFRFLTKYM
jgi:hypothetical protein